MVLPTPCVVHLYFMKMATGNFHRPFSQLFYKPVTSKGYINFHQFWSWMHTCKCDILPWCIQCYSSSLERWHIHEFKAADGKQNGGALYSKNYLFLGVTPDWRLSRRGMFNSSSAQVLSLEVSTINFLRDVFPAYLHAMTKLTHNTGPATRHQASLVEPGCWVGLHPQARMRPPAKIAQWEHAGLWEE